MEALVESPALHRGQNEVHVVPKAEDECSRTGQVLHTM